MCRVVSRELDGASGSAGDARRFVADTLAGWDLDVLVVDSQLMVSELVGNAVQHARSAVGVSVSVADGTLEVGVTDGSRVLPRPPGGPETVSGRLAESGRGLYLVNQLADAWGSTLVPEGKQVWFRLDVGSDWPHLTSCPCGGDDLERVRLESGRYAVRVPDPWSGG